MVAGTSSATANTTSLSWSHTVGSGANRLLVVGVSIRNANNQVATVTYAGKALTKLQARDNDDGAVRVEQWYLIAPPSGTGTVTVSVPGGAKVVGGAVSFTGADQVAPFRGLVSAGSTGTGTNNPTVADSSSAGELVVSTVATEGDAGPTLAPLSGQSQAWKKYYGTSGGDVAGGASTKVGSASLVDGLEQGRERQVGDRGGGDQAGAEHRAHPVPGDLLGQARHSRARCRSTTRPAAAPRPS